MLVLFIFLTAIFFLSQTILPYDFTHQFIMTQAERTELQQELGLDLPLWQQYFYWIQRLFQGEVTSFYGFSAAENLKSVLPPSLLIFSLGTIIAFLIGQWLGKMTAWRGAGFLSGATTFSAIAFYTAFPPWLVFLLSYFFIRRIPLFRPILHKVISQDLTRELWLDYALEPNTVILYMLYIIGTAILIVEIVNRMSLRLRGRRLPGFVALILAIAVSVTGWYGFGFGPHAVDIMGLAAFPIVTFVMLSLGETMFIMQITMRDTLNEGYIALARAKGLPSHVVRDKHAARNALLPVFSRLVVSMPYLLTGMVIIERAVPWPGMGNNLFEALYSLDMPIVMGSLLVIGILSVVARLVLEIIQMYFDPRIREHTTPLIRRNIKRTVEMPVNEN
jgi:peptide/nickel transport system permease protein